MNCNCNCNITINAGGQPYIANTQVVVGTESVNIALGWRNAIPSDATTTLPVNLTLNGVTRELTLPNGTPVTVADLLATNVFQVFNDRFNGILALMSRTIV